jgi:Domain of Unknown Function (DUF1206)
LTSATRRRSRSTRYRARKAASSPVIRGLARAGLVARGVLYVVIGWLAIRIAMGSSGQQADRTGALHAIAATRFGEIALWLLVVGFAGLALWRLTEAAYGAAGPDGKKTSTRLAALGSAVVYVVIAYSTLKYALGLGAPQGSNQQSVDLTAAAMRHPGGQAIVVVAGLAIIAGGVYFAYQAWQRRFLRNLQTARMRPGTRKAVTWLGLVGGIARGVVFVTAGIFLVVAAVKSQPGQAKGVDSALRELAATPSGPWLLALVAIGLIMFGLYSVCEARWFRD